MSNLKKPFLQAIGFVCIFIIVLILFNIRSFAFDTNTDNVDWSGCPEYDEKEYENCDNRIHNFRDPSISGNGKNIAHVSYRIADANNKALSINYVSFTYDGELEDSLLYFFYNSSSGNEVLGIQNRQKTNIIWQMKGYYSYNWSSAVYTDNSPSFSKSVNCNISAIPHVEIIYSDVDVADFHNVSNVNTAISSYFNGDKSNLIASKDDFGTKYDGKTVYLNNFKADFFDSTELTDVYVKFTWSIPEHLDSSKLQIVVDTDYNSRITYASGIVPQEKHISTPNDFVLGMSKPVDVANRFDINKGWDSYVSTCTSINSYLNGSNFFNTDNRIALGQSGWLNDLNNGMLYRTELSRLDYKLTLVYDGVVGCSYYARFNFIDHTNDIYTSTPDDYGAPTYSNPEQTGTFNTDWIQDAVGNVVPSYRYDSPVGSAGQIVDGSTGEIKPVFPDGYHFYIHYDDKYYELDPADFNTTLDSLRELTDISEQNKYTYGFLHDVLGVFPTPIWSLIIGGLGTVFVVSFIKILRG